MLSKVTGADVISYGFATAYHLGGTFNPYGFGGSLVVKRVRETGNLVRVRISMNYSAWKCFSGIIITRYGGCAFVCSMADNYSYDGSATKLWGSETFTFSKGGTSSSSDVMYYDFKSSTGWNSFLVIGAISNPTSVPLSDITVKGFTS